MNQFNLSLLSDKNFSPRQLAAFTSFILSVPIALGIFILVKEIPAAIIAFVLVFAGSYGLVLFVLQRFIYRKIKLIYKLIYNTKAGKKEEFYNKTLLPQKGIDEVREDVENWAQEKSNEILALKRNEAFRREFLQNLSHELKTPVFTIQGYVDTMLGGALYNESVNEKFLNNTSKSVDRLINLLEDLDEISKLEGGVLKLNTRQFIIQDLVKEVADSLELKMQESETKFLIKKGCETPLNVFADKERIRQVITNLIDNAIKYGKLGGTIEASFYKVDDNNVLIEISDNGNGIAENQVLRVFERFYRTDVARSRKVGGSGLGLSICKHIIEAHGHNIHIRSKQNVGTTIGFTLDKRKVNAQVANA